MCSVCCGFALCVLCCEDSVRVRGKTTCTKDVCLKKTCNGYLLRFVDVFCLVGEYQVSFDLKTDQSQVL